MQKNTIILKLTLLFCFFSLYQLSAQSHLVNYDYAYTSPNPYDDNLNYNVDWGAFPEFHLPSRFMCGYEWFFSQASMSGLGWDAPLKRGFTHSKTWLNELDYQHSVGAVPYGSLGSPVESRMIQYGWGGGCGPLGFQTLIDPVAQNHWFETYREEFETGNTGSEWGNSCPLPSPSTGVPTTTNTRMSYQVVGGNVEKNAGLVLLDIEKVNTVESYYSAGGFDAYLDCVQHPGNAGWCDPMYPMFGNVQQLPSWQRNGMPASYEFLSAWEFKKAFYRDMIMDYATPFHAYKSIPSTSRAPIGNYGTAIAAGRVFYDRPAVTWNELMTDATTLDMMVRDTVNFTQFGNPLTDAVDMFLPVCYYPYQGRRSNYNIYSGEWLWDLLYNVEVSKRWAPTKPVYPYFWLRAEGATQFGQPTDFGAYKDPTTAEALPIFTIMSGGDGFMFWDDVWWSGNNSYIYSYTVKGMHRLSRFNHFIDAPDSYYSNYNPLQVRDMATNGVTNSGVIRAIIKGDSILVAAINPYATSPSQITTIPINYRDGNRFLNDVITLVGRETFLGVAILEIDLPVNVASFDAQYKPLNNTVKTSWTMSDEEGVVKYEVERSEDKTNFITLGEQLRDENAKGQYAFTDYSPIKRAYYRVKITDLEGNIKYTNAVEVNINSSASFELMPNPGTNELKIEWTDTESRSIKVFSPLGQLVQQIESSNGNSLYFNTESWVSGTYLIVVETETGESVYKKWIKL